MGGGIVRIEANLSEKVAVDEGQLIRLVSGLTGTMQLSVHLQQYGEATAECHDGGFRLSCLNNHGLILYMKGSHNFCTSVEKIFKKCRTYYTLPQLSLRLYFRFSRRGRLQFTTLIPVYVFIT